MGVQLDKKCPLCGDDNWNCIDKTVWYVEHCVSCRKYYNNITKQDFVDNFQCPDCNCLEATLEENKKFLATRCKHCGKQTIVIEKHTTNDVRSETIAKTELEKIQAQNKPKCPTCGSTNIKPISATKRTASILSLGILSNSLGKTYECKNCKYKW